MYTANDARNDALMYAAHSLVSKIDEAVNKGCTSMDIEIPCGKEEDIYRAYLGAGGYTLFENDNYWNIDWGSGGHHIDFRKQANKE